MGMGGNGTGIDEDLQKKLQQELRNQQTEQEEQNRQLQGEVVKSFQRSRGRLGGQLPFNLIDTLG